ncbi:MAG: HPr family phosphocarrier protein [Candidatus Omnitrophica bacterium]|nr:HPr family phosphocarrier protein [Candidatus Omnitrophota bacterium]
MPRVEKEIIIQNRKGLHIRVASEFVKAASQFRADVFLYKNDKEINGKSIMSLLTLEGTFNSKFNLVTDGDDAQEACEKLEKLLIENQNL